MIFRPVPTDPDHDQDAEDDLFYRDTLQELVQIGTTLARLLQTQAIADAQAALQGMAPTTSPGDHATAFDRISRAVRRTIALARSLREPVAPAKDPARPSAAARTPTLPEAGHPAATPGRDDAADAEVPGAGLRDRPEAPDRDAPDHDDTGRPPAEIIEEIRRDLGLDALPGAGAWTRRTPADTGQQCMQAAPSGAAANAAYQPGSKPHDSGPQSPEHGATQHSLNPQPDRPADQPAATPRAQPDPGHAGESPPDDPAPTAMVLRHPPQIQERWRPPPAG